MRTPRMYEKERSLELILSRLLWVRQVRKRQYDSFWHPWFIEGEKIGSFKGLSREGTTVVIYFSEHGYSCHEPTTWEDKVKAVDSVELPLMVTQPYWQPAIVWIEKRLKGELKETPLRQDLVDKYEHYEHLSSTLHRVDSHYRELLFREVQYKFKNKIYKKHGGHTHLIVLKCKGQELYVDYSGDSMKLLGEGDVLIHTIKE